MTLMAYLLRDWVHMQIAFAVFSSSMIVLYFMVRFAPGGTVTPHLVYNY